MPDPVLDYSAIEVRSFDRRTTRQQLRRDVRILLERCRILEGGELFKSINTKPKD